MGNHLSISDAACIASATVLGVQLLTPADPIGKSFRLLKQLRKQVSRASASWIGNLYEVGVFEFERVIQSTLVFINLTPFVVITISTTGKGTHLQR